MGQSYDNRAVQARRGAALGRPELRPSDDFSRIAATTLRDAMNMKKVMQKRGLRQARARCPECDGTLHGALVGPKDHMRFICNGPCARRLTE